MQGVFFQYYFVPLCSVNFAEGILPRYRLDIISKNDTTLTFNISIMCTNPFYVKLPGEHIGLNQSYVPVPCRHCMECLQKKRNTYFNRLVALSESGEFFTYFITLTYDEEHVTHAYWDYKTLYYRDVQLFFKRLRKFANVKFVICGEYGSNTGRPHYHMILFSDIPLTKKQITETWKNGFIDIELLKGVGGLSYICKYITKPYQYPASLSYRFGLKPKEWENLSIKEQRFHMKKYGLFPQFVRCSKGLDDLVDDLLVVNFIVSKIDSFFNTIKEKLPYGTLEKFTKSGLEFDRNDYQAFQEKIMSSGELSEFVEKWHSLKVHGKIDLYLPLSQLCSAVAKTDICLFHFVKNLTRFLYGFKNWTVYEAIKVYGSDEEASKVVAMMHYNDIFDRLRKNKHKARRIYQKLLRKDMF